MSDPTISIEEAQANLDAILATTSLSVRLADRSVQNFVSQKDRTDAIEYWRRIIAALSATTPRSRFGFSLADFRSQHLRNNDE